MSTVSHRHDILILFDVTNGNPNGDPDAGNLPRIDPTTNRGLVSDVCLKRKVRNYVAEFAPERKGNESNGYTILVTQGNVLNNEIKTAVAAATAGMDKKASNQEKAAATKNWLCREFFDVRAFGGVLSTGEEVLKGSAHGQVRGPVQFTFARSQHPIAPLEVSITRCAVTKEDDASKERTMGNKYIVPYALYLAKAYVSPIFAQRTGFDDIDLDLLFTAIEHMFHHDQSSARAEMAVRALYDFEHVGTQAAANVEQNLREARLGCAHAHRLFEAVKIELDPGKVYPESFADYTVSDPWADVSGEHIVPGVRLHRRVDPRKAVELKATA